MVEIISRAPSLRNSKNWYDCEFYLNILKSNLLNFCSYSCWSMKLTIFRQQQKMVLRCIFLSQNSFLLAKSIKIYINLHSSKVEVSRLIYYLRLYSLAQEDWTLRYQMYSERYFRTFSTVLDSGILPSVIDLELKRIFRRVTIELMNGLQFSYITLQKECSYSAMKSADFLLFKISKIAFFTYFSSLLLSSSSSTKFRHLSLTSLSQ